MKSRMKARIEKKLSKHLIKIAPSQFGIGWVVGLTIEAKGKTHLQLASG